MVLRPEAAQLACNVHARRIHGVFHAGRARSGPGDLIQMSENGTADESAARAVDMRIAVSRWLSDVVSQWRDEMKAVLRAGHRHVQQPPFLFDLLGMPG